MDSWRPDRPAENAYRVKGRLIGPGVDLRGADLSEANLRRVDLSGADLSEANLRRVDLNCADLSDANLVGANLQDADLSGVNLWGAVLRGADLDGTDLFFAVLFDADLREVDLRRANLRLVRWSDTTRWPPNWETYLRSRSIRARPEGPGYYWLTDDSAGLDGPLPGVSAG